MIGGRPSIPTPAWHYAEANRLLVVADANVSSNWPALTGEAKADILAAAQVHATLATVDPETASRAQQYADGAV